MRTKFHPYTPTRPHPHTVRLLLSVVVLFCVTSARAEVSGVTLTVGDGWAVVRELRPVELIEGEQQVVFENIPAEAEIDTFVVRSRRVPVHLVTWGWADGASSTAEESLSVEGDAVVWKPGAPASAEGKRAGMRSLLCTITSPVKGTRALELIYRVGGMTWSPHYQVLVRGGLGERAQRIAVDFSGWVQVGNTTSRSFSNALVRLVGTGQSPAGTKEDPPGILMLDTESPLADMWKDQPVERETSYAYRVPQLVNLAERSDVEVPLVTAQRTPAHLLYTMDSEDVPLSTRDHGQPLEKKIVFLNKTRHGLGWVLPPGPVDVFLGGMRGHILPGARIPYTPVDAEIRIDLGQAPNVLGRRHNVGHSEVVDGAYEAVYELVLENERSDDVTIEIVERPPPILEWNVISASAAYSERSRLLRFKPTIPANTEKRIQYTLRVRQPSL